MSGRGWRSRGDIDILHWRATPRRLRVLIADMTS